ncbi:PepSY-associated TM helix domain-containing protein [Erythrobacter tepidarius]|uniref:PepSY-associated TM helix domain-containing protein n=1 Tax=Erythrobacter tepidarius TaxID=60454 RepID=UPI000A3A199F|nr:PepSY-associated TM helix domain-containing protein [Erythrobacter tepidarius]
MREGLKIIHRWLGGLVGLGLAVLGLTGAALAWKPWWVGVPLAGRAPAEAETLAIITAAQNLGATHVTLPSAEFGVAQVGFGRGQGGAYLAHDGTVLARWQSAWERPETFLFDLHHHLLMGSTGEVISGWLGIAAVLFCITGLILWWPTRRTFRLRPLPRRFTRPAVILHHRDIGAVLVLPILLASITGALMVLKPLGQVVLAPLSPAAEVAAWQAKPPAPATSTPPEWPKILAAVRARFPDGTLRMVIWPKTPDEAVTIRVRRPAEWHHNGRTTLTLAADGTVLMARDATTAPRAIRASYALYPLHSTRLAGSAMALPLRAVMTLAGLGLGLLGSLAVITFWRMQTPRRSTSALQRGRFAR